jgi:hypothetical protein
MDVPPQNVITFCTAETARGSLTAFFSTVSRWAGPCGAECNHAIFWGPCGPPAWEHPASAGQDEDRRVRPALQEVIFGPMGASVAICCGRCWKTLWLGMRVGPP